MKVKELLMLLFGLLFILALSNGSEIFFWITVTPLASLILLDVFLGEPHEPLSELEYNNLPKTLKDQSYMEYIYDYYAIRKNKEIKKRINNKTNPLNTFKF